MATRGPQFEGPLFHGTSTPLEPGDTVLPPNVSKADTPNSRFVSGNRAFTPHDPYAHASASASESHAWEFAGMTAQRSGGRATVFRVGRPDDVKKGLEPKEALSAKGFPVQEAEHIRPPEDKRVPNTFMKYAPNPRGRQGTLPIDWSDGRPKDYMSGYVARNGDSLNHPTERDRLDENKRAAEQEAARQPEAPKPPLRRIKGQMELPGMRQKRTT